MSARSTPLVLVVDDQSANVQLLSQVLDESGYDVLPALSGAEALARAEVRAPDLVLLDLRMPDLDGIEVCERLRAHERLEGVPVIFVTAAVEREFLARAFKAGAVDYVTKPFVVEELLARVRTHIALKQSRDRLAAMLREREEVTNIVAHDLKNPLTCTLFAAQSLLRGPLDEQRREELAQEVIESSESALQFIKRFLLRSAEGEYLRQFAAERVDLRELAEVAARMLRSAGEARSVRLVVEGDPAPVQADAMAVRNVLQNLIANAVQHSPVEGEVRVRVEAGRDGYSRCLVMDRGPGISEQDQKKLFRRFVRLAAAKPQSYSSGLGLAIAKNDVAQMGGYLWFEPRTGGGSIFGFELPRHAVRSYGEK